MIGVAPRAQAYLRLQTELPYFRQPVGVVSLFMTALFGRNLADDRPHLGPHLVPLATKRRGRLASLAMMFVPYRKDEDVENGVATTRDVLRATIDLAHSLAGAGRSCSASTTHSRASRCGFGGSWPV